MKQQEIKSWQMTSDLLAGRISREYLARCAKKVIKAKTHEYTTIVNNSRGFKRIRAKRELNKWVDGKFDHDALHKDIVANCAKDASYYETGEYEFILPRRAETYAYMALYVPENYRELYYGL